MYVRAKFLNPEDAAAVIESAVRHGVTRDDIEIFSARPVEFKPALLDRPSRASLVAVVSALVFGAGSTAFMFWTQLDYPLITGGMPLNSGWATGPITFEFTMMGAILGTVGMFLWESRLFRSRRLPAPAIRSDVITVQLFCEEGLSGLLEEELRSARTVEVEWLGGSS